MPAVSVVMPSHDRPGTLGRAVASVLAQTQADLELIIVDDGSALPAREVARDWARRDARMRVIERPESGGPSAARNDGLRAATAPLVAFLDDDDTWLPGMLEVLGRALAASGPRVALAYGRAIEVRDGRESLFPFPRFGPADEATFDRALRLDGCILLQTALVRRSVLDEVGLFDEGIRACEDTDLLIRIARRYTFLAVPEVVARYHRHAGGLSRQPGALDGHRRMMAKLAPELAARPDALAMHHRLLIHRLYRLGRPREALAEFRAMRRVVRPAARDWARCCAGPLFPLRERAHQLWSRLGVGAGP
ncbi:MAG: glycosyltransferase family 2 protein [Halobacteriales archaeon]|nr:glycosyltransferase family 2 protein [Halobacteriales archaeon]